MFWFAAAVILLIADMFLGTLYLLIVAAALFAAGLTALLFSENFALPFAVASAASAAGLFWVHRLLRRRKALAIPSENPAVSDGNDLDIGQTVIVLQHLYDDVYEVRHRGTLWHARALNHNGTPAETAVISGKQSTTLLIHLHH